MSAFFFRFQKRHNHEIVTTEAEHGATAPHPPAKTPRLGGNDSQERVGLLNPAQPLGKGFTLILETLGLDLQVGEEICKFLPGDLAIGT